MIMTNYCNLSLEDKVFYRKLCFSKNADSITDNIDYVTVVKNIGHTMFEKLYTYRVGLMDYMYAIINFKDLDHHQIVFGFYDGSKLKGFDGSSALLLVYDNKIEAKRMRKFVKEIRKDESKYHEEFLPEISKIIYNVVVTELNTIYL